MLQSSRYNRLSSWHQFVLAPLLHALQPLSAVHQAVWRGRYTVGQLRSATRRAWRQAYEKCVDSSCRYWLVYQAAQQACLVYLMLCVLKSGLLPSYREPLPLSHPIFLGLCFSAGLKRRRMSACSLQPCIASSPVPGFSVSAAFLDFSNLFTSSYFDSVRCSCEICSVPQCWRLQRRGKPNRAAKAGPASQAACLIVHGECPAAQQHAAAGHCSFPGPGPHSRGCCVHYRGADRYHCSCAVCYPTRMIANLKSMHSEFDHAWRADPEVWAGGVPKDAAARAAASVLDHVAPLFPSLAERVIAKRALAAQQPARGGQQPSSGGMPAQQAPAERLLACLASQTLRAEAAGIGSRAAPALPHLLCVPALWDRCRPVLTSTQPQILYHDVVSDAWQICTAYVGLDRCRCSF